MKIEYFLSLAPFEKIGSHEYPRQYISIFSFIEFCLFIFLRFRIQYIILPMKISDLQRNSLLNSKNQQSNKIPQSNKLKTRLPFKGESYESFMKYLIAHNSDYFRAKITTKPKSRSNDLRLKIPTSTGKTVYRNDYTVDNNKQNQQPLYIRNSQHESHFDVHPRSKLQSSKASRKDERRVDDQTNYRRDFSARTGRIHREKKAAKENSNIFHRGDDSPKYFQTLNKTQYINWKGTQSIPSMKPIQKYIPSNYHLQNSTTYRTDFNSKSKSRQLDTCKGLSNFPLFNCGSQVFDSCYSLQFPPKKIAKQTINYKPKIIGINPKKLKGKTEYKTEYINKTEQKVIIPEKSLEEIQQIILNL